MSLEKNTKRNTKKRRVHPVQIPLQVVLLEIRKRNRIRSERVQKRNQSPHQEALHKTPTIQSIPARTFKVEFCLALKEKNKKVTKSKMINNL